MRDDRGLDGRPGGESGFALILAILALMLLTFLGLTLAVTTSTELQIASNYRWSQMAFFNAQAGAEIGKRFLGEVEWRIFMPDPRGSGQMSSAPPPHVPPRNGPSGEASRNFENQECDTLGGQGYGVVFDSPTFAAPFQNTSTFLGQTLNGSFTIWVRRPLVPDVATGSLIDYADPDRLIMTVEGTAPLLGAAATVLANRAIRYVELELSRIDPADCENYTGQAGSGPSGAGYDPCAAVQAAGVPGAAGFKP